MLATNGIIYPHKHDYGQTMSKEKLFLCSFLFNQYKIVSKKCKKSFWTPFLDAMTYSLGKLEWVTFLSCPVEDWMIH